MRKRVNFVTIKLFATMVLSFITLAYLSSSARAQLNLGGDDEKNEDSEIKSWYEVTEEEINYCRTWGGANQAELGVVGGGDIAFSQLTATIQAQAQRQSNLTDEILYTVAFYVEPFQGTKSYSVKLTSNESEKTIDSGSASRTSPGAGYFAEFYNETYTHAVLSFGGQSITVPIVG